MLIRSAIGSLNPSGGVGAKLLLRYGGGMREELHALLKYRERHFAQGGEVFVWQGTHTP
ncbi:hypothetical protein ACCAA_370035 [Candidatus Accumulibacter aalborgensis]|uniref:Uncharacterized protein n=1 Tax=Candidatus Accumulibacter aalborgensis TaxID=1860102 RepID=A0A1A8XP54_9PROT|nr:hypothetical protein ACCAA_370035 [Candidatus Accumulibacter aalborgensis]